VRTAVFTPDGRSILSAGQDGTLRLWEIATGKELRRLGPQPDWRFYVAFSPDSQRVVSGSGRVWDATTGRLLFVFAQEPGRRRFDFANEREVTCAVFSPDGRRILSGNRGGAMRVLDAASGKEIRRWQETKGWADTLAFSPDGKLVVSAGGTWHEPRSARTQVELRLYDERTGKEIRRFTGHTDVVASVAFSPDGQHILSGSHDKTVRLWHVASGKEVLRLEGHTARVNSVAFSPDGKAVVSAGGDTTIRHHWIPRIPAVSAPEQPDRSIQPRQPNPRQMRWKVLFNTKDGKDYADQLHGLGAILAVPLGDGKYEVVRDLRRRPAVGEKEDLAMHDRLYWLDDDPRSLEQLAAALGWKAVPPHVVAIFPEQLEKHLRELERKHFPGPAEDIKETHFRIGKRGNSYDVSVVIVLPREQADTKLHINIHQGTSGPMVMVENKAVPLDQLADTLRGYVRDRGQSEVVLSVAADVPYQMVLDVQEAIRLAGMKRLNLVQPGARP
jgi:dipeptidyl aminopeptidase/acylaminoacyl peptidase